MEKIDATVNLISNSTGAPLMLLPAFKAWQKSWQALEAKWEHVPHVLQGLHMMQNIHAELLNAITTGWEEIHAKSVALFDQPGEAEASLAVSQMDFDYWEAKNTPTSLLEFPEMNALMVEPVVIWDTLSKDARRLFAKQDIHSRAALAAILSITTRNLRDNLSSVWSKFISMV